MRLELDLPYGTESIPFGELDAFVQQARRGGADADTPVEGVVPDQDDSMLIGLRVELPATQLPDRAALPVDRDLIARLLSVLRAIPANDGDARPHLTDIDELTDELTDLAIK